MSNNQINSFYDLEDMSRPDIVGLGLKRLQELLEEAKEEQRDLFNQYKSGDSLSYPPSWYDNYVFPVDCLVSNIQDAIDKIKNDDEDSEEEDSWEY